MPVICVSSSGDRGRSATHCGLLPLCLPWTGQREGQRSNAHLLPRRVQIARLQTTSESAAAAYRTPLRRLHPCQRVYQAEPCPHRHHLYNHQERSLESVQTHQHHQVHPLCSHGDGVTDDISMVTTVATGSDRAHGQN